MEKLEYKKVYKELYLPKEEPSVIDVPEIGFAMIEGAGDPNGEDFAEATEALYSFSYVVKMSYKSKDVPEGFYDYTVFPLEGVWDLIDKDKPATLKSNLKYQIMIRQPDFLTPELFQRFLEETKRKKPNSKLEGLCFVRILDGLCCQMMHVGSYDTEPVSFARMEAYCEAQGYQRSAKTHREIYLGDPRKTEPEKLKTVLRVQIVKK